MTLSHPTFAEIYDTVQDTIQDDSYTQADVMKIANKGRLWIASHVLLPALQTDGTVTTVADVGYVALPTDYHQNIYKCYSNTLTRWVTVYPDYTVMIGKIDIPDQTGQVAGVAVRGAYLYYQNIPDDDDYDLEELKLFYYAHPGKFEVEEDQPTELHAALSEDLLAEWCNWKIFNLIEDGLEGQKINTLYHKAEFELQLASLKRMYRPPIVDGRDSFSA